MPAEGKGNAQQCVLFMVAKGHDDKRDLKGLNELATAVAKALKRHMGGLERLL